MTSRAESAYPQQSDAEFFAAPHQIRAFLVGLIRWENSVLFPSFPGRSRADTRLARHLSKRGVPNENLCFLKDEDATIEAIRVEFKRLLEDSSPGETLLFYYAGHGALAPDNQPFFSSYDTRADSRESAWFMGEALEAIESNFKGDTVVFVTDCCHSGAMGELLQQSARGFAYASLASTAAEDDSSGNWTFTESLLLALTGARVVPGNPGGDITFAELADFARADMALFEGQRAKFLFAPSFNVPATLSRAHENQSPGMGDRIEVQWGADWFKARVISQKGTLSKVHYIGFPQNQDEWVEPHRIRPIEASLFPENLSVEAEWNGEWWKAKVLDTRGPLHYVRYTERSSVWDEWLVGTRLRLPPGKQRS